MARVFSAVGFIYAFGFVMMTPQLYINYRLRSVAHLPWRAMVYKSLNTFIDDIFAFIIKQPTLRRLACLRDDVIFLATLYQRWIYPIDKSRINEFGQGGDEDADEVDARKLAAAERPMAVLDRVEPAEAPSSASLWLFIMSGVAVDPNTRRAAPCVASSPRGTRRGRRTRGRGTFSSWSTCRLFLFGSLDFLWFGASCPFRIGSAPFRPQNWSRRVDNYLRRPRARWGSAHGAGCADGGASAGSAASSGERRPGKLRSAVCLSRGVEGARRPPRRRRRPRQRAPQ